MKKLYISCPIEGRDWKDVVKSYKLMHMLACVAFDEKDLEIINHPKVLDLEKSKLNDLAIHIANMSTADYFVGVEYCYGPVNQYCNIERGIAHDYGIPHALINIELIAPDYRKVVERLESTWDKAEKNVRAKYLEF